LGKEFDHEHSFFLSKAYRRIFDRKLSNKKYDVLFAPASSSEIAFLKTRIPIVYVSDATFANMVNYYPRFSNLLSTSIKQGNEIERRAITNASIVLYPSEWAANSAIKHYGAEKSKVHVIPFGANIDHVPSRKRILQKKKTEKCRLLFLGRNWLRKGGEIAYDAFLKLNQMGVDTDLNVCGCIPPSRFSHEKMNSVYFINKNEKFETLLFNSDFLILPTKAECFGIVFCEASAYGIPSIAANTGGVNGAVKNGENGFLLPPNSSGKDYADLIADIFQNDEQYYSLVQKSRNLFDEKLNWDAWAKEVKSLLEKL
jgi:glycosyltransferase involved in cell wall biosynthesis